MDSHLQCWLSGLLNSLHQTRGLDEAEWRGQPSNLCYSAILPSSLGDLGRASLAGERHKRDLISSLT